MAPDVNTMSSPRNGTSVPSTTGNAAAATSTPASRRASQIFPMSPPPLPLSTPGGTLSTAMHPTSQPFPPLSPGISSATHASEGTGVPMRHPRPLTAAELHLELEKEQEAVVNRLTRELTALRAHSASVASTASSNASGTFLLDTIDPSVAHGGPLTGPTHPTSSRRHRSSSSVSRTSQNAAVHHAGLTTTNSAGVPTPHRYSISSQSGTSNDVAPPRSASIGLSTPRYEEVAYYRQELEEAKKENEALKRKIRELERTIRGRRSSSAGTRSRGRSQIGSGSQAEDSEAHV